MIIYRKTSHLRLQRVPIPEPPYWAATIIAPYSPRRAEPIAIDYLDLQATRAERFEVAVCDDVRDELERAAERGRVREPVLIDAAESAEVVFRRGQEALEFCAENDSAAIHLVSSRGALPQNVGRVLNPSDGLNPFGEVLNSPGRVENSPHMATVAIAPWPLEFDRVQALFDEARARQLRWGVVVPVMYPVTTNLTALAQLAEAAHGATFFAALPIEVDAAARKAIAESVGAQPTPADDRDESYEMLFHADLEPIHVATERHIAALAAEIGSEDFIVPPRWDRRTNWNASVLLTLAASRMLAMKRDVETAWRIVRSARAVVQLEKPIERVAEAAHLSIIESLDPISVEALTEWIETGRSSFVDHIAKQWRLRRDAGV